MRPEGSIYIFKDNAVATITFAHPAANSFPSALLKRLVDTIQQIDQDDQIKTILLKSEGDTVFCSGASFEELVAVSTLEQGEQFFSGFAHLLNAMRTSKKIIIGCVQGKVVGGGVGIVAACDYVYASEQAALKLSELSIGIGPFVIAPAIERKAGLAALSHMTLAPKEWKNAYWGKEVGLYAKVFETNQELETEVLRYSSQFSEYSLEALSELKKMLWTNTSHWDHLLLERAAISGRLVLSEATKKALQQFKK